MYAFASGRLFPCWSLVYICTSLFLVGKYFCLPSIVVTCNAPRVHCLSHPLHLFVFMPFICVNIMIIFDSCRTGWIYVVRV